MQFEVNGEQVEVADDGGSLLEALRAAGFVSVKDGCSPQGQCGCCTVLVDGAPRVSCVTPVRRVRGRSIETIEGLGDDERDRWVDAFVATGASQCGFCTPGIICRLVGAERKGTSPADPDVLAKSLAAHLCRCTGWQTIAEAAEVAVGIRPVNLIERDMGAAAARASLEGHAPQQVGPSVVMGHGGFADDLAPTDALVAVANPDGEWFVGESLAAARAAAGKVQGRRTTLDARTPIEIPEGEWDVGLSTAWVEPAYLEPDAVWATPDGEVGNPLANGGAFGSKLDTVAELGPVARRLAVERGRPVRVLWSREDVARSGPKRPPIAIGMRADGSGVVRVARTAGIVEAITRVLPGVEVEEIDLAGPPTSASIRAAGWAEAEAVLTVLRGATDWVIEPSGGRARASFEPGAEPTIRVEVDAGEPLDETVLRSYAIGAAHMAFSWVTSEQLTVDAEGEVHDLTVRSFGVVKAADTPSIEIVTAAGDRPPVSVSDAVFAAVAGAVWLGRVGVDPKLRVASWPLP